MTPRRRKEGQIVRLDRAGRGGEPSAGLFAAAAQRATGSPWPSPCCDPLLHADLRAFHRHRPEISGADLIVTTTLEACRRAEGRPPVVVGEAFMPTTKELAAAFALTGCLLDHMAVELVEGPRHPDAVRYARWVAERLGIGDQKRGDVSDLQWSRPLSIALWSKSRFADRVPEALAFVAEFARQRSGKARP